MTNLKKSIKELREQVQLSQHELARRSEISVSYISKLEAGEVQTLSIDKCKQLANGLGLTMRDFLAFVGLLDDDSTPNANQMLVGALRQRKLTQSEINEIVSYVDFKANKKK